MSRFFIDRPIFAWVLAIVVMLAGLLAILKLPVAQYPAIAPPAVTIAATYPGASASTLQDSVTQVIEQRLTGLDGLRYMKSTSDSSGRLRIELTFNPGVNPDIAQVQVQNKLALAIPVLPEAVQRQGVQVTKSATGYFLVISVTSSNDQATSSDIADYIGTNLVDAISRVNGVGEVQVFGGSYAMRVWLDPIKMRQFAITTTDIKNALRAQNVQLSAGELGASPTTPDQVINASILASAPLETADAFKAIVLRTNTDGAVVRLGDIARVAVGSDNYNFQPRWNGRPASGLGIRLASGANALDTAKAVQEEMQRLQVSMPADLSWRVVYDVTPFVKLSIEGVVKTLIEAVVLVFLVMYLFLQNFRATLIPTIAVPVVLLGTFAILGAAGFTINTLTLFATVLAIGLLVDDAIVVVENVERLMAEEGLSPLEATRKSMEQITGALIGIGLVLSAVFMPMAFFGGSAGVIYKQFSVTIVAAMALSVLVALILTPALCATLLKPIDREHSHQGWRVFTAFNRWFNSVTQGYGSTVSNLIRRPLRYIIIYVALVAGMFALFTRVPGSFLPDEDMGVFFLQVQLPAGASQAKTTEVLKNIEQHFLDNEHDVQSIFTIAGFSFSGTGQNMGIGFVKLRDWSERPGEDRTIKAVVTRTTAAFSTMRDAVAFAFAPPPIRELGNATGFNLFLQDTAGLGRSTLIAARGQLLGQAAQSPILRGVRPNAQDDTPQYELKMDAAKAGSLGLSMAEINDTLSTAFGGVYVNDYLDRGRVKKVYVQADAPYRMMPDDLKQWTVKNQRGDMVPLANFSTAQWSSGPPRLERYNGLPAVEVLGQAAPGYSTGQAMAEIEKIAAGLPPGISLQWTGLSYEEKQSGAQSGLLYALSLLIVFLCLAALYESWSIPFSVMMIVPLGVVGALAAVALRGLNNDVYFQVALLTTIGLSAKNAILIVEFAKEKLEQGVALQEAVIQACRLRLRPIIMTSVAFALGVLPLAISSGAGSGSQHAIGTGILGGTVSATLLGLFFVPLFFVLITEFVRRGKQ